MSLRFHSKNKKKASLPRANRSVPSLPVPQHFVKKTEHYRLLHIISAASFKGAGEAWLGSCVSELHSTSSIPQGPARCSEPRSLSEGGWQSCFPKTDLALLIHHMNVCQAERGRRRGWEKAFSLLLYLDISTHVNCAGTKGKHIGWRGSCQSWLRILQHLAAEMQAPHPPPEVHLSQHKHHNTCVDPELSLS